ncbi:HTH_Tnp_Tc3_2 domain-containing protein [Trichonephila clavipes]|nr:HTH_Tnp_Tc3_2 domain-containing protein [Trichonephila clavipes]
MPEMRQYILGKRRRLLNDVRTLQETDMTFCPLHILQVHTGKRFKASANLERTSSQILLLKDSYRCGEIKFFGGRYLSLCGHTNLYLFHKGTHNWRYNAQPHRAMIVKIYPEDYVELNRRMEWLELNQIEHIWDNFSRYVSSVHKGEAGRRAVFLARWIVRSVPLEIVGISGHEKVPTRGKPVLERPGRPRGERIVRQALADPTVTRSTIRADVGVAIVPQTISRHLAEANLKSKRPFRALPLTPEHRQLRLQWCQARSMWNVTGWQKVAFSDESRFVLGTNDNRVRVWRRPGAIFQQDIARPHIARVAQDFLRHFQTLPWPARSPDLSPVEHVWDQLKRQMPSCHSVHDLELAVQDL